MENKTTREDRTNHFRDQLDRASKVREKATTFKIAAELVEPIVDKHGLDTMAYGPVFAPTTKYSKVEQHLERIMVVADWLRD